ncbi:MAG: 3-methyl-2-oxobutanoate hydroxymethyltransferase [Verrucomicrobiota bacterium]
MQQDQITVEDIQNWQGQAGPLALTAYDYTIARLLDEAGVDILHVGDSLGMILLGHEDTTSVSMDDMLRATEAVARGRSRALITSDLPFGAYKTPEEALENGRRLIDAGADAVKMEGGEAIAEQTRFLLSEGIPLQGHIGMLPQHIKEEGAYKKKGKSEVEADLLSKDALLLEELGIFSLVLESVVPAIAAQITEQLTIPTIGIASGSQTTGQIRVYSDVIGLTPWFNFPHVQNEMKAAESIKSAVQGLKVKIFSGEN